MQSLCKIAAVAGLIALLTAGQSPAQAQATSIDGAWALTRSVGVRLPRGNCSASGADRFTFARNTLTWIPPSRYGIPSLRLRVLSHAENVASVQGRLIPVLLNVRDRRGQQGKVWITGNNLVQRYQSGIEITFRYCGP
jgi:hypothetical protein